MHNYGINGSGDNEGERFPAGRGRGRGNRASKPQEQSYLRRPHFPPQEGHKDETKSVNVSKSTLSPDAAEFVPSHLQNPGMANSAQSTYYQRPTSVQNRFELARQSVPQQQEQPYMYQQQASSQQSFYPDNQLYYQYEPQNMGPNVHYNDAPSNDYNRQSRMNNEPHVSDLNVTISHLEMSMRTLTLSPGEFDHLVSSLVDSISPFLEDSSQCREIISVIIKQSITEGNFRYNGARLCTHLDTVATPPDQATSTFRDILLQQCQEETQTQGNQWQQKNTHTDDEEKRCHGLIMFLAELVTQMHSSAPTLGKMLIQLMSVVLLKPAPNSAKNICQALKLAGQTLERDNAGSRKDMETVMKQLAGLVIDGRVDSHIGRMVDSVTELRSNSWGRTVPNITPTYQPQPAEPNMSRSQQLLDEPVFYGPDGKVISSEESEFLQDLTKDSKDSEETGDNYNNDEEYLGDDDEDDIIAEAYEEFLKMSESSSNQIKRQ